MGRVGASVVRQWWAAVVVAVAKEVVAAVVVVRREAMVVRDGRGGGSDGDGAVVAGEAARRRGKVHSSARKATWGRKRTRTPCAGAERNSNSAHKAAARQRSHGTRTIAGT